MQSSDEQQQLLSALGHMETALKLLDEVDAPADIGAHLDLALCRLRERLEKLSSAA